MTMRAGTPRVVHIFASFAQDDPQARRCARLIEAFGGRLAHTVVSGSGDFSATDALTTGIKVQRLEKFPMLHGLPLPGRLQRIARALQDYDLVLTYGRGAIDAALAHTMFSKVHALPPLIHHEDGSDETARQRRGTRSKWYRRVGLGKAAGLVVPSETMEHAALIDWQQPLGRVKTIRDGVELKRFSRVAKPDAITRLLKRPGEYWVGCIALSGSESDVVALVQATERLAPEWHLVIFGEAPTGGLVTLEVARRALDHRIHFAPVATDRAAALALFDIVAVAPEPEPLSMAVIEAMAAGRPIAVFGGADIAQALGTDNADLVADHTASEALERLAGDRYLRDRIGSGNRERAEAERDETAMIAAYRRLYSSAIGRNAI